MIFFSQVKYNNRIKQKFIFINILSLTKGICKKIALDSNIIWFCPFPHPTHDLPPLILLLFFLKVVCIVGCAASLTFLTYVISFIFRKRRKNNGFWSLSFFIVSIYLYTYAHLYSSFLKFFFFNAKLSINTLLRREWSYFFCTSVIGPSS